MSTPQPMTYGRAVRRVAMTAVQALAAVTLSLCAYALAGTWDTPTAILMAITGLLVPVATAVHRLAQAWLERDEAT